MNQKVILIDALACGFEIESAASLAQMSIKDASLYASEHQQAIELRRKEVKGTSEIMLPSKRWYYLTKAASMGVEGYAVATITGLRQTFMPGLAIQAVKVANEMTAPTVSSDSMNVSTVITEMYRDLRKSNEGEEEVWDMISKALPDYAGAIQTVRRSVETNKDDSVIE